MERLPVPLRDAQMPERDERFATAPVIAVYDAELATAGYPARFRVRLLDGGGAFTVHATTEDGTATVADGDYVAIDDEFTFVGEGFIEVDVDEDATPGEEFFLRLIGVTPMLLVRDFAKARINDITCVYEVGVYEAGVYLCS
jgi:hypothetical protein